MRIFRAGEVWGGCFWNTLRSHVAFQEQLSSACVASSAVSCSKVPGGVFFYFFFFFLLFWELPETAFPF